MESRTAPGYWPTRILLTIAILMTAATVAFGLWALFWEPPMFGRERMSLAGMPARMVLPAFAIGMALLGLACEIRIFRGTRDEPPRWRYRDR